LLMFGFVRVGHQNRNVFVKKIYVTPDANALLC
jgi:hypothetical protein